MTAQMEKQMRDVTDLVESLLLFDVKIRMDVDPLKYTVTLFDSETDYLIGEFTDVSLWGALWQAWESSLDVEISFSAKDGN